MKNGIGYLLAFVGGAGCGVTGTYIFCKKKFEELLDQEIQDFKKNYRGSRIDKVTLDKEESEKESKEEDYKTTNDIPEKVRERVDVEYTDYAKLRANYTKPEITEETPEDVLAKAEHPEDGEEEDIRLIDVDVFASDTYFEKDSANWYTEDDVLTDSFGDVFEDPLLIVGECLEAVDLDSVEGNASIYIRNEPLGIDYDVTVIKAKHADMIE